MTNSIGTSASSMASMASSVFSGAREALKAMTDAANPEGAAQKQAAPGGGPRTRIGTVLDCYA